MITTTTSLMNLNTKRYILNEFIRRKETELQALRKVQQQQLDSANQQDIDNSNLSESPKSQMMDEIELQASRLDYLQAEIDILRRLNVKTAHNTVSPGSLIRTNIGYILVGTAFPIIMLKGEKTVGISMESPLYQKMKGLKAHTEFHLGSIEYVIFEII
jgi:hypothetical protein